MTNEEFEAGVQKEINRLVVKADEKWQEKELWFAKEAAVDAANVSSDMAMDIKLDMAGI